MFKFLICFIAGIGAGLGTGFAGISAYTYGKNENLDIRSGIVMMVTVLGLAILSVNYLT